MRDWTLFSLILRSTTNVCQLQKWSAGSIRFKPFLTLNETVVKLTTTRNWSWFAGPICWVDCSCTTTPLLPFKTCYKKAFCFCCHSKEMRAFPDVCSSYCLVSRIFFLCGNGIMTNVFIRVVKWFHITTNGCYNRISCIGQDIWYFLCLNTEQLMILPTYEYWKTDRNKRNAIKCAFCSGWSVCASVHYLFFKFPFRESKNR